MKVAEVGAVVRAYRKASGLSQQELADLAGISRATLNYLESGRDIEIGAGKLLALLDLLGIAVAVPATVDRKHDERTVDRAVHAIRSGGAKSKVTRKVLDEALATGRVPEGTQPLLRAALDHLSGPECTALVRCVVAASGQPAKTVWRNARSLADQTRSTGWLNSGSGESGETPVTPPA